jgi:amidase
VKDLIDVADLPTTAGSRAVADQAAPAAADAACLAGLRAAVASGLARLVGKVNLHELAYGITGINPAFGTPVNPLDPRRVPGGSSSGSATAVASGEADITYGTDTGGSIRIPAACCGIAGLKTTWGRISLAGVRPLAPSLDTVGPMARDIAGLAAGMALLEPGFTPAADAPTTIGLLNAEPGPALDAIPAISTAVDSALRAAEFDVRPVTVAGLDAIIRAAITVLDAQAWNSNKDLVAAAADKLGDTVLERLRYASTITQAQVFAAQQVLAGWQATLAALWRQVELLAFPTLTGFPPLIEDASRLFKLRALTSPVNAAGLPALVLPVPVRGSAAGSFPASLQLIGPLGSEERLLAAGAVIERAVRG